MRKRRSTTLRAAAPVLVLAMAAGFAPAAHAASTGSRFTIQAGALRIGLDSTGTVTSLIDPAHDRNYADPQHKTPLIRLVVGGAEQKPTALSYNAAKSTYTFTFGGKNIKVGVRVAAGAGYSTFEVTSLDAPSGVDVETLLWGPITTSITQTVGETVGVVHDSDFAIGIHGLNDKTPAGWPDEFKSMSYTEGTQEPLFNWPYGWFAAHQTTWGSILQAYTYDYTKTRHRYVGWDDEHESNEPIPPLSGGDAQIKGSKIALFGTAPGDVLNTLSHIETGQGLPHTKVDGQWEKTSQGASQSFLVLSDLGTADVTDASKYANKAGIRYLYSLPGVNGPWQSSGHYQFDSAFGGSDAGAAGLVDTAADYGLKVGVHTLSNLIDTNDPYATPVPSDGLATMGSVKLTRPLAADAKTAYVDGNAIFTGGNENILRVGDELLSYGAVTKVPGSATEYQVTLDSRAMWGTTAAAEPAGSDLTRIQRYAYGQFVGGMPLMDQIAGRLAQISNTTGVKAMSYDGLETASLAGYGLFGTTKLVNGTYRKLDSGDDFISEASNLLPGTWDATTRVGWGAENGDLGGTGWPPTAMQFQPYYDRNYMPHMMGWRGYGPGDSVLSQEWELSKMAAFNAGAGMQTSVAALKASGNTDQVLGAWKEWEAARNAHAFTQQQMTAMQDMSSYWHLETVRPGKEWNLSNVEYPATALSAPSDGTTSTWTYTNTHDAQPLQFQLQASGGSVTNPSVTLNGKTVTFPATVPTDGYLVADGTSTAKVYDKTWHQLTTVTAQGAATYTTGDQNISYTATGTNGSTAKIRFLTYSAPQHVKAPVTMDAPTTVQRGSTATVTSTYTNTGTTTLHHTTLSLVVPKGWTAKATHGAGTHTLAPGRTMTATWHLTPPADAKPGANPLVTQATYDGARTSTETTAQITVPDPVAITTPALVKAGGTGTVTTTYTNGSTRDLPDATVALTTPAGWTAKATTPATFPSLKAGQTATTTWQVTPPADAKPGANTLTAKATYRGSPVTDEADGQIAVPYGSVRAAFDNAGISDDSNPAAGDLDGGGRSLSAQTLTAAGLTPGAQVTHDGVTFTWPDAASGAPDNVNANGQTIALTGTGATLGFLATGTGDVSGTGTVTYTDGTTQTYSLTVNDWTRTSPATGTDILATLPHRNAGRGGSTDIPVNIYGATVGLKAGKTVAYLTLPDASGLHIFAAATG
ncbi:COG1470 family protein [Streptomyces sp. NBC_00448]|uniref:COG1470 family protein n=1 Tax=Streptomyces sp. NBC_00448 TaxID=2903652 RepID=UPI002E218AE1